MTKLRADARRNRERLLEVAGEAFASEGLAVQIDEIASRAGVGIGTVYRHFPTKEALFEAVVSGHKRRLIEKARSLFDHEEPGEAFFGFANHIVEASLMNKALADEIAKAGADVPCDEEAQQELYEAVGELLARAQRAEAIRSDVDVADVLALLSGVLLVRRQNAGGDAWRKLLAVVCDGLRAGTGRT